MLGNSSPSSWKDKVRQKNPKKNREKSEFFLPAWTIIVKPLHAASGESCQLSLLLSSSSIWTAITPTLFSINPNSASLSELLLSLPRFLPSIQALFAPVSALHTHAHTCTCHLHVILCRLSWALFEPRAILLQMSILSLFFVLCVY